MADGSGSIPGRSWPTVKTTCPYCGVGCGVEGLAEGRNLSVAGDRSHPANQGRLCSKGLALGSTVVPDATRGTGLAFLGTTTNVAKLLASLLFGLAWTVLGTSAAIGIFAAGLVAAGILAAVVLHRTPEPARA